MGMNFFFSKSLWILVSLSMLSNSVAFIVPLASVYKVSSPERSISSSIKYDNALNMFDTNQQSEPYRLKINHMSILKFGSAFTAFILFSSFHIENNQHWDTILQPLHANARNLPISNGAVGLNRGKAVSLVPILKLRNSVNSALLQLPNVQNCKDLLSNVPNIEKDFKILFDEHSEGISYKQQFLDQNAFLVYYTKGFDGPGRPSIEDEDSNRYSL
jgi:hypothetical protein